MATKAGVALSFPDGPRLELDDVIDDLVVRAQSVKRVQGRLRTLLRSIEMVNDDISLDAVLRHIVDGARLLSGARRGVLTGVDDACMTESDAAGTSLLAIPIRVNGEPYATLCLTESENVTFSDEDEELVRSLAFAAGTAIANARRYDESRRQQRWLAASVDISHRLLTDTDDDLLATIARSALDIVAADLVSISLVSEDGADLRVEVAIGEGCEALTGGRTALVDSPAAVVLQSRSPVITPSTVLVPLPSRDDGVLGVLEIARRSGRPPFHASELSMAAGFAGHAGVALEFARVRADQQRIARLEDRDRIARDLHDHVIQQLFAIGLSLKGLAMSVGPEHNAADRLAHRVEDVDRTIRQIRTSIFELRSVPAGTGGGLRARILEVAADLTPALGFAPHVTFAGQVDLLVDPPRADDLVACVREMLTNVAKHARAGTVDVELQLLPDEVQLTLTDDGCGMPAQGHKSGLGNLRARAESRGGSFKVRSHPATGTRLTWKVPIR